MRLCVALGDTRPAMPSKFLMSRRRVGGLFSLEQGCEVVNVLHFLPLDLDFAFFNFPHFVTSSLTLVAPLPSPSRRFYGNMVLGCSEASRVTVLDRERV